jgi:ribonucleotide reductase alpha subunit
MFGEIITRGLINVDPRVADVLNKPYDSDSVKNLVSILGKDMSNIDNMKVAGRLKMWDATRACSIIFAEYCAALEGRLSPALVEFGTKYADAIEKAIENNWEKDYLSLDYLGAGSLTEQILLRPAFDEDPAETTQQAYMRQAIQLHMKNGIERVLQCYEELANDEYTNSSPINFNAGTKRAQMISCFKKVISDDLHHILYEGVGDCGMISKGNGGLGICLQFLRHSRIGTSGNSDGAIRFAQIFDTMVRCVNQGGQRDGAATFFMRIFHIDVPEFIISKDPTIGHNEQIDRAGTCTWMSNLFFKRVEADAPWTLFCPSKIGELNNLYNYDMEFEYVRMERLAKKRKVELVEIEEKCKNIKNRLLSDPSKKEVRQEYMEALKTLRLAKKNLIEHRIVKAQDLYKTLTQTQTRSGKNYVMHGDAINYKSNMKHLGPINMSNLCLEICLPSTPEKTYSCNLSSSNLRKHTTGKLDWRKEEHSDEEIRGSYDFSKLGKSMHSQVENLNEVIDHNNYPIDELDKDGNVVKMGDIHATNLEARPLGIGVSGQFEALAQMDTFYDSPAAVRFNKMLYACKYFNGLCKSLEMAVQKGAYPMFREGSYKRYLGVTKMEPDDEGTMRKVPQFEIVKGSPLANGQFNFDLWKEYAQLLSDMGDLDENIYDRADDEELDPSTWGQEPYRFSYNGVDYCVEPTWDSLRALIMEHGVRNSQILAIMPTASSAQRFGNSESTEVPQNMIYTRRLIHGQYTVVVEQMVRDLEEFGFWNGDVADFIVCMQSFKYVQDFILDNHERYDPKHFVHENGVITFKPQVAERMAFLVKKYRNGFEYSQKLFVIAARQRGIYICQSQSLNLNFVDATEEILSSVHSYTNKIGLKTGLYYLRQDPVKAIGNFNVDPSILLYRKTLFTRYPQDPLLIRLCGAKDVEETVTVSKDSMDKLKIAVNSMMANVDPQTSPSVASQLDLIRNLSDSTLGSSSDRSNSPSSSDNLPTCQKNEDGTHDCCG